MLRTASNRDFTTGARARILAMLLGLLLTLAGALAAEAPAAAADGPATTSMAVVGMGASEEPAEPTDDPTQDEAPLDEAPLDEAPLEEPGDDGVDVEDEGFPLWAIVLIILLVLVLALAIGYAATRDRRDRI